ncbi:MAG: hypothetical protein HWD61_05120 [Parachlamydiaceae bacterium]|nr:MAG: hypothetical protein HWD61_05120 [Parachlamydiaceae bacterium]
MSTLPIMSFLYSCTATGLEVIFLYIFGARMYLSLQWIGVDFILMPACDALLAFSYSSFSL